MASVFKRVRKGRDPKSGRVVQRKSRKWYAQYRDAQGRIRRVVAFTDKSASLDWANRLEREAVLEAKGLVSRVDRHRSTSVGEHVECYERFLLAKGNTLAHVKKTRQRIDSVLAGAQVKRLDDITASSVMEYLAMRRTEASGFGVATSNHYLTSIKGFCNWLVDDGRLEASPLMSLKRLNPACDVRRQRRTLSLEELKSLFRVSHRGGESHGLSGRDRAILYLVAVSSGLRAKELASLTLGSLRFEGDSCVITLDAAYSKRRRKDAQPLAPHVCHEVRRWIDARSLAAVDKLWPGTWNERAAEMLRGDLEAAGIAYKDDAGQVYDFHSLRHQFITELVRSGASPKAVQELARHSTITLSLDRYTHSDRAELTEAVGKMRPVSEEGRRYTDWCTTTGVPRPEAASNGTDLQSEHEPVASSQVVVVTSFEDDVASDDANRPGRTRTCDQGIMSPLL